MSKSLGNFITIKDALAKYHPDVLKIFFLQAHYSSPIDFSEKKMEEAKQAYERIANLKRKLEELCGALEITRAGADFAEPFKKAFEEYMDDDFNTPRGLSVVFDMVNKCNILLADDSDTGRSCKLRHALDAMKDMLSVFGFSFAQAVSGGADDVQVDGMIAARAAFKKEKKFKEADDIRKKLEADGIILEDTKTGTTWRRKL
jgi:cysteinyl-tRNA synthetase